MQHYYSYNYNRFYNNYKEYIQENEWGNHRARAARARAARN